MTDQHMTLRGRDTEHSHASAITQFKEKQPALSTSAR